jgi:5-enolpyruvylshikimate-3-phosphate synthase
MTGGRPVHVRDPGCVSKTYPGYFTALAGLVSGQPQGRDR